nr:hypothetical protein [Kibdelosporangium sp. MJ126-NF4]
MLRRVCAASTLALLAGCGGSRETDPVLDAAARFESAVASHDGVAACSLLAPEAVRRVNDLRPEGCAQAVPKLSLPTSPLGGQVQVWGDTAQVRAPADTLFLRRFPEGWRIIGAGCRSRGERPYECTVDGT